LRAEHRYNWHTQEVRKMHRTTVITQKKPAVSKDRQKKTEVDTNRMAAFQLGRLARSPWFEEPQDVRAGYFQNAVRNFREMLIAPPSTGNPCPRMDADQKRVGGNAPREKKRPGMGLIRACQS
jgi:hypothetical protein